MDQNEAQALVANFVNRALTNTINTGFEALGLSPLTTASAMMQCAAAAMAHFAARDTVALLRAYANCIEAGPGDGPAQQAARQAFFAAADSMVATARASINFPVTQSRA
jgi:hypothetical protein